MDPSEILESLLEISEIFTNDVKKLGKGMQFFDRFRSLRRCILRDRGIFLMKCIAHSRLLYEKFEDAHMLSSDLEGHKLPAPIRVSYVLPILRQWIEAA